MSELHALLIGIDDYFPGRLPDGTRYPSLQGATRDVERMEAFLLDRAGLQPERTWKLLSRAGEDGEPAGPPDRQPTYANIVAAFKRLAVDACPGDRVYIHYSGHGARMPKAEFPGAKGLLVRHEEALVPCDIGDPSSRYLKDVELSILLWRLAERGLLVTVVLDCCHSGGVMRNRSPQRAVARRVQWVSPRTVPSAVVDDRPLREARQKLQQNPNKPRHFGLKGWVPAARYEMFAACRPDELAFEYPFENREPQGALTYWLLETLTQSTGKLRYDEIHRKLVAHVHGFFAYQTPVFLGDPGCGFLAEKRQRPDEEEPSAEGATVLRIGDDGRVLVDIGAAAGARVGGKMLWKGAPMKGAHTELIIDEVGSAESWARPSGLLKDLEPGARIQVFGHRAGVRLIPPPPGDVAARRALDILAFDLRTPRRGQIVEICEDGAVADLIVAVGANGTYEILDPEGVPFPNLSPLSINDPGAALKVLQRLEHLARFRRVLTTENPRPAEWLRLGLELDGDEPEPFPPHGLVLRCEEARQIRIVNRSSIRLDIAVLDLAPDYSITQLLPERGNLTLVPLDPEQEEVVSIHGWLPPGWQEGTDVLKVFATQGTTSFRWLELPALGSTPTPRRSGLTPSAFPEEEWITTQAEIHVRR